MTDSAPERLAFSVAQFVALSGLSRTTVHRLRLSGALKTVKVGGRRLIPAEAAYALIRDGAESPPQA